jgi:hypothetical protein
MPGEECSGHSADKSQCHKMLHYRLCAPCRAPGKLIYDKLFGQEQLKMILLPPFFLAVLAGADAIV